MKHTAAILAFAALLGAAPAFAQGPAHPGGLAGFQPLVPVSSFARPASWFDPSRLRVSTSVSVGSGFTSQTQALQVTTLNYQFDAPLTMSVSLGNTWGTGFEGSSNFFLEGLSMTFRPTASTQFHIDYRNLRSPLQYGHGQWGPAHPWDRY